MKYFNLLLTLAIVGLLYSCYPKGADYVDELDTYISKYDPAFFDHPDTIAKYKTFIMPDKISYYKDGEIVQDHDHEYDAEILGQFENNMINKGFVYANGVDTSLIVSVESHELTNGGYIYPPDWGYWDPWNPWYPGYPGGWYPWYPWYPGGGYPWYPSYYTFQTGTLIFNIGNIAALEDIHDTIRVPVVYIGAIDGLLQGSDAYLKDRIDRGIDQLFKQAPFDKLK